MQGFFVDTKRKAVVGPAYYTLRRSEGSRTGRQAKQATLLCQPPGSGCNTRQRPDLRLLYLPHGVDCPYPFFYVVNLNALTTRFVRCADGVYSTDSLTARTRPMQRPGKCPSLLVFNGRRPTKSSKLCAAPSRRGAKRACWRFLENLGWNSQTARKGLPLLGFQKLAGCR